MLHALRFLFNRLRIKYILYNGTNLRRYFYECYIDATDGDFDRTNRGRDQRSGAYCSFGCESSLADSDHRISDLGNSVHQWPHEKMKFNKDFRTTRPLVFLYMYILQRI